MKITYYGTAAGEAWPGVFCRCELCEKARALGRKEHPHPVPGPGQ